MLFDFFWVTLLAQDLWRASPRPPSLQQQSAPSPHRWTEDDWPGFRATILLAQDILKRDGDLELDQISYKEDTIEARVDNYLEHDMIFLPINIKNFHWYLAVVDARKREIHVLDSMGKMDRTDLNLTHKELNRDKWKDLEVATWPIIEKFEQPIQKDGHLMINFMEYWTGSRLYDTITQDDINNFRFKLPAILWASRLNTRKLYQEPEERNEEKGSPSDVEITDAPDRVSKPSNTSQLVESDTSPCILSHVLSSTKKCITSYGISRTKRIELLDALCGYIMLIDDANSLEKEWIQITKPYPISLSLKKLQDILNVDKPMDSDCFNMAIRMLACNEALLMIEDKMHYMDLKFWSIIDVKRDPRHRAKLDVEGLAKLF
ncbi:hypothetical protein ACP4OV_009470 [Aristida adscensionis]